MKPTTRMLPLVLLLALPLGCNGLDRLPSDTDKNAVPDLPLGDRPAADIMSDSSQWGSALTCKTAPTLPSLVNPHITVSLNGLTLHLTDAATGFDKVFPVGVGAIDETTTDADYGESNSYEPLLGGKQDYAITPSSIQPCKFWWTDPDTGAQSPVFAGLPFMSWDGAYAIHGPIDNFTAPNGGNLRRGYVSHGCIRMEAADVLEVYARIKSVASTPVHVQRDPERLASGVRVDVPQKWVSDECVSDGDCNFTGGYCAHNAYSDRGFCSLRCTAACPDMAGRVETFCVTDPSDATQGMCVSKMTSVDQDCRPLDHFVTSTQHRFKQTVTATVCMPGSPGWVGDHCLAASDCKFGSKCADGICTESCTRYCSDEVGWPTTFCAADPTLGNECLRECTPASNASECPADSDCVERARVGEATTVKYVCVPHA